jgi:UDP:flavonoid glycosyltransferase YjiC (YdhE family)
MSRPSAAFFAMPEDGHFGRLRPLISGLVGEGIAAYVFTDRRFEAHVERAGGTFVDLFGRYPLERADAHSIPRSCRYVSFAGHYAEEIVRDLEELGPSLVVYDTFAVIGRVVGASLGVPYVNVLAGHNRDPARAAALIRAEYPRVEISPSCLRAVERLRERYGLHDASPFAFEWGPSPFLNVYGEPPAYLTEAVRRAVEPVAFYSSLPPKEEIEATGRTTGRSYFGDTTELKVYVSFGTVVWRYWAAEALAAMESISQALASMDDVHALFSLGGADIAAESVRALSRPNVSIASSVDQWRVLQEADVFVTHNGMSSTHEAIFHRVPMISYPFFADQPGLAEKCRSLGLAIPLTDAPRGRVTPHDALAAFAEIARSRDSFLARLDEAREWELEAIENRDAVHRRIAELVSRAARPAA